MTAALIVLRKDSEKVAESYSLVREHVPEHYRSVSVPGVEIKAEQP